MATQRNFSANSLTTTLNCDLKHSNINRIYQNSKWITFIIHKLQLIIYISAHNDDTTKLQFYFMIILTFFMKNDDVSIQGKLFNERTQILMYRK